MRKKKTLEQLAVTDRGEFYRITKENRERELVGGLSPHEEVEPVVTAVLRGFLREIGTLAAVALKTGIDKRRVQHFLAGEADLHGRDIDRVFVAYGICWEFDESEEENGE